MTEKENDAAGASLFPTSQSEMGTLIRALDWSKTPLGPIDNWPPHLRATVNFILPAKAQIVVFWGPEFVPIYNDAYAPAIGERHPKALGRPARENWAELWDDLEPMLRRVADAGETVHAKDRPFYVERHGYGETVYFDISYSPVYGPTNAIDGILCIVSETTDRIVAERKLATAQERLTQALSAGGMVGVFDWDVKTDLFYSDRYFAEAFSVDAQKAETGAPLSDYLAAIHPGDLQRIEDAVGQAVATGERYKQEYRLVRKDGAIRWVDVRGECLRDEQGQPSRFVGVAVDVTERKEMQERQQLLLQEMNHRVKNLLAVFRGLIGLSARAAATPQDMAESLRGRLDALAQAKELVRPALTGNPGANGDRTDVGALVRTVLAPYAGEASRTTYEGPHAPVGAKAVTSLALALHETATNAAKYGGLSVAAGAVRVAWTIADERLRLEWRETGGPAIAGAPQRSGFGSILAERSISGQLGGEIAYDWRPEGLTLRMAIPLARLAE